MNLALQAQFSQRFLVLRRAVGAVGIDRASMAMLIGRGIQEFIEDLAIVHVGWRDGVFLDQLGIGIRIDVVLVAVMGFGILLGPAGIGVFLTELRRPFGGASKSSGVSLVLI